MNSLLPTWSIPWLAELVLAGQIALIVLAGWVLRWLLRRLVDRLTARYDLPPEVGISARRIAGFLIGFATVLAVLQRLGVSGSVLWTAFTGFAAVAAVAFFAAWSVLSNIFCALLILITRPFRLYDHIELVESGDKPGLGGRVVNMNLIHVTVEERHASGARSTLRLPNSLFFQRATRRWHGEPPAVEVAAGAASQPASASRPAGGGASLPVDAP